MKMTVKYKITKIRLLFLLITILFHLVSCGNGSQSPNHQNQKLDGSSHVEEQRDSLLEKQTKKLAKQTNKIEPTKQQVQRKSFSEVNEKFSKLYDFTENLSQAHLRSGGILIDFGTKSRNKNTLGDWKTGWRGNFKDKKTTFSYLSGNSGRIYFFAKDSEVGGGKITIRAKSIGSKSGRVYLNGKHIGNADFSKDKFDHATVEFSSGIKNGNNEILLRYNTRHPAHDRKGASLAVDYVRIISDSTKVGSAVSSYDGVLISSATGGSQNIILSAGESITYNIPVPKGAVIRGQVASRSQDLKGELKILVADDQTAETVLNKIETRGKTTTLAVSLSQFAKTETKVVSISFKATLGEVVLQNLAIFEPKKKGTKAPGNFTAKNVMLVLIDTLRADHLSFYNNKTRVQTNYLDKLAKEGMVFKKPFAQENWTKPSITTLLSGLYPQTHQTKTEKNKVPRSVTLAAQHFKEMGFTTAGFIANGYISGKFGFKRGWDKWINYVREGKPNRAQFVSNDVIKWLKERSSDKPFFLYVHTIDPHVPYIPPKKYRALYDNEPYNGKVTATGTAKLLASVKTGAIKLSNRDKFRLEALYDGEITYHDEHLARINDELKAQNLLEDTLIIVTSDHGEEFFDHGSVGHGHSMYEELLHVPLIFRLPSAQAVTDDKDIATNYAEVGLIDILPTICEILGILPPKDIEGKSLLPLLKGSRFDQWPSVAFSDFLNGQRAVRMGRFKLIYRGLRKTVFDLKTDPAETTDLTDDLPITFAALRDLLGSHQGLFITTETIKSNLKQNKKSNFSKKQKNKHKQENTRIDPETRKQLEALGYMGE